MADVTTHTSKPSYFYVVANVNDIGEVSWGAPLDNMQSLRVARSYVRLVNGNKSSWRLLKCCITKREGRLVFNLTSAAPTAEIDKVISDLQQQIATVTESSETFRQLLGDCLKKSDRKPDALGVLSFSESNRDEGDGPRDPVALIGQGLNSAKGFPIFGKGVGLGWRLAGYWVGDRYGFAALVYTSSAIQAVINDLEDQRSQIALHEGEVVAPPSDDMDQWLKGVKHV